MNHVRRKKIIALAILFMFLLSSVCMAAYAPDLDRWGYVYIDDHVLILYDTQTTSYKSNDTSCDAWLMFINYNKGTHSKDHAIITKDRKIAFLYHVKYDSETGEILDSKSLEPVYADIIPNSVGESIYEHFFPKKQLQ